LTNHLLGVLTELMQAAARANAAGAAGELELRDREGDSDAGAFSGSSKR
jgi:hypothetical protein